MNRRMLLALGLLLTCATHAEVRHLDYAAARTPASGRTLMAADPQDAANGVLRRFTLGTAAAPKPDGLSVGDTLEVTLFPDVVRTLQLVERTPAQAGRETFLATTDGCGTTHNAVVIATPEGLQIDLQDYQNGRVYAVAAGANGVVVSEQNPSAGVRQCGCAEEQTVNSDAGLALPELARQMTAVTTAYVDVMVAYDTMAATYAEASLGGITNFAETCVQKMNTALANTGLTADFRFRLVGVFAAPGDAGGSVSYVLNSIVNRGVTLNGYNWSELERVRKACGADVVSVLVDNYSAYGTTGSGYSLQRENASYFADSAYNACLIRAAAQGHTMTHEVGHNMGAGHATAVDSAEISPGPQYYDYSAGHYFTANGRRYNTIMAYNFDGFGNSYTEVPYFSSPEHFYQGVPVGDADHDNTRTLRNTFAWVAQFRAEGVSALHYTVNFDRNDGSEKTCAQEISCGTTTRLTSLAALGWARRGFVFKGWSTSPTSRAVRYANWANVCDAAAADETLTLYAVWELADGYYEIRFNKYDGSGAWRSVGFPYGERTRLPSLANGLGWAKRGFDFQGWTLRAGDSVWKGDWAYVSEPVAAGRTLDVWASWEPKDGYYILRFVRNDGTAAWRAVGFPYGVKTRLPSVANGLGWDRAGYDFIGWSLSPNGAVWKEDWSNLTAPFPAGTVRNIYAIWE